MNKFKRGDKVIESRTGDIGTVKYYEDDEEVLVKWETGFDAGASLLVSECAIEYYANIASEDEVTPTEIMYKGKIYVLKGE